MLLLFVMLLLPKGRPVWRSAEEEDGADVAGGPPRGKPHGCRCAQSAKDSPDVTECRVLDAQPAGLRVEPLKAKQDEPD